jgi:hypothetical protein
VERRGNEAYGDDEKSKVPGAKKVGSDDGI